MKTRTFGYIDFILKNRHRDWTDFHDLIQQLEDEQLNDSEIAACIPKDFDLSTDG